MRASGVAGVPEKNVSEATHTHSCEYLQGVDRGDHTKTNGCHSFLLRLAQFPTKL